MDPGGCLVVYMTQQALALCSTIYCPTMLNPQQAATHIFISHG